MNWKRGPDGVWRRLTNNEKRMRNAAPPNGSTKNAAQPNGTSNAAPPNGNWNAANAVNAVNVNNVGPNGSVQPNGTQNVTGPLTITQRREMLQKNIQTRTRAQQNEANRLRNKNLKVIPPK